MKIPPKTRKKNLTGQEIVNSLLQGHAIRRSCWVEGFYVRICNEAGFDDSGIAIPQPRCPIYSLATNGYFSHFGHSSQPFSFMHYPRDGEGLEWLLANDWEDCGFISRDDFDELEEIVKDAVRERERSFRIDVG